jgi:histone H2A
MRKEAKAGILFPVGKINKRMQNSKWTDRVGGTAPIWVAAVCDYITREIVQQASDACKEGGKHKRLQPRDVILAVRNDPDLHRLFAGVKILVGDKLKNVTDEVACDADKRYKTAVAAMSAADA